MNIFERIGGWVVSLFSRAKREFDIEPIRSGKTEAIVSRCGIIYAGAPEWLDVDDNIRTVNFARTVCAEIARLSTLGISITVDGSARAEWMQLEIDKLFATLRQRLEHGCAYGTIIIKPSDESAALDVFFPEDYAVTEYTNGKIIGAVFKSAKYDAEKKRHYTRYEWHRFVAGVYTITNRCFVSPSAGSEGEPCAIEETPWAGLADEVTAQNVDAPLFAVLRMPSANNVEPYSPYALPVFSDAVEELRALDIAFSRSVKEIDDSGRIVFLDTDALLTGGESAGMVKTLQGRENLRQKMKLPDYVRNVQGNGTDTFYQEVNPALNTEERLKGINALLSQIGFKCGFSNGYFVFNQKTGMVTATQVEADDRRTIQTIDDIRTALKNCINELCYALDKFADAYNLAPVGAWEITYDFSDITHNVEEDRARMWGQVVAGKFPYRLYLIKYEGYSEEEAAKIIAETAASTPPLYADV